MQNLELNAASCVRAVVSSNRSLGQCGGHRGVWRRKSGATMGALLSNRQYIRAAVASSIPRFWGRVESCGLGNSTGTMSCKEGSCASSLVRALIGYPTPDERRLLLFQPSRTRFVQQQDGILPQIEATVRTFGKRHHTGLRKV